MNDNALYWLWLQNALGAGAFIKEILEEFGSARAVYEAGELEWKMSPVFTPKQIESMSSASLNDAEEILYACRLNRWQIICYEDREYPESLRNIAAPPAALYVDGVLPSPEKHPYIAVVGTRKASDYAVKVADVMSRGIAEKGAVVVSGGALGVDTAAHNAAILASGKTVAVLGCGLGTKYLMENKPLRDAVKNNGALVTEFPPFSKATKYTFPIRNRIISGLSLGVLVVEAGIRSGSLITARYAIEQGRDVYAVPCSILDPEFAGTNRLIDDGAIVATKPLDLLFPYAEQYNIRLGNTKSVSDLIYETRNKSANIPDDNKSISFEKLKETRNTRAARQKEVRGLKGEELNVYRTLSAEFIHIDEIAAKSNLPVQRVLSALTTLELLDLVQSAGGKRYKLS